ncbi:MAG: hypothetical protein QM743_04615 [Chitinophagaceae bacterium]
MSVRLIRYLLLFVLFLSGGCKNVSRTNWSVSLNREGKDPYDLYLGYHSLQYYHPESEIRILSGSLESFQSASDSAREMMLLIGRVVNFSKQERERLYEFVSEGNDLVICSSGIDPQLLNDFHLRQEGIPESDPLSVLNPAAPNEKALSIESLPDERFGIYGRNIRGYFVRTTESPDSTESEITEEGYVHEKDTTHPDIMCIALGEGHLVLASTPLLFSNFFLLQPHNRRYLDAFWKHIGPDIARIYWGNFRNRNPEMSDWDVLLRHPAVRTAILLGVFLMIVYLLVERKRKQRIIAEIPPVENTYASFIETVGLLYYNHKDNHNLCVKLEQHFLEWVRTRFLLPTEVLDEHFIDALSAKAGVPRAHAADVVSMIHRIRLGDEALSDAFLFEFYGTINLFYKANGTDGYNG